MKDHQEYNILPAITLANKAADAFPAFAPSSAKLAYLAMDVEGYESDRQRLKVS